MSIGKALAHFHEKTKGAASAPSNQVLFVHGMLGEREGFGALVKLFKDADWACHHFRYASQSNHFHYIVRSLEQRIARAAAASQRLCVLGHSFGCRLIAAAAPPPQPGLEIVFIAPPTRQIAWARRGMAFAPARRFLGGSLAEMAQQDMDVSALDGHRLKVVEGKFRSSGDGWLRPEETQLSRHHHRTVVEARHSALPSHPETQKAIASFLKL